jgi:hypothetical protein
MFGEHWYSRSESKLGTLGDDLHVLTGGSMRVLSALNMPDLSSADRGAGAHAGPPPDHVRAALDGAFAEQMKVLFSQLCNGLTTGLPKPDPKLATDRFATGLQAACAAYEIGNKLIG